MRPRRRPARDLRTAIHCMPQGTRQAMLEGIDANRIIVGAYTDPGGGICPMLAAHRNGGRTSLASFARAWDRYTTARKPRPATEREVRTLRTMLEESIALGDDLDTSDFKQVIAEHRAAKARRRPPRRDTGERDRTRELAGRHGWAWLKPFRRLDEFELAMRELDEPDREREPV